MTRSLPVSSDRRLTEWLYPSWSVHLRFKVGTAEVYIGIHNCWRWDWWTADGSIHMMAQGYETEEEAVAASPCAGMAKRLIYGPTCKITYEACYAWVVLDPPSGIIVGRTGFHDLDEAQDNVQRWLAAGDLRAKRYDIQSKFSRGLADYEKGVRP